MPDAVFRDAERHADELAAAIQHAQSLDPAYAVIEQSLARVRESGLPVESLLPAGERRLGFSLKRAKSGKSFWENYADVVRKKLCTKNSKLRTLADSGATLSAGALVGVVAAALALPAVAIGIATGIAAIIATSGIDAFCEYTKPAKTEKPAKAGHGARRPA